MSVHSTSGIVAWSDTDASGRFHHTAAYRWAESTEHALYRSVLPDIDIGRFPRRATAASYHRPLTAGDEYTVGLEVEHVGNSSITYTWTVTGPAGVCVRGEHTAVHVDADGRPAPVPQVLRERLVPTTGVA
ncbi:acyl-CoA thioesterase [Streptomyces sp. NPDC091412]|uniref:acyl-CoA thioesterase n=1 Tax=Streptomyces sp. NPDC091412 TaxID=3366002 RepID=UPI00382827F0